MEPQGTLRSTKLQHARFPAYPPIALNPGMLMHPSGALLFRQARLPRETASQSLAKANPSRNQRGVRQKAIFEHRFTADP